MTKDVGGKKTKLTELTKWNNHQIAIALRQKSKYILHIQVKKKKKNPSHGL